MPEQSKPIFFDTVTLSNFALSGSFDLIITRYGFRAVVTMEVLNEILAGISCGYTGLQPIVGAVQNDAVGQKTMSWNERRAYAELLVNLGSGEASCLACAQVNGGVVATDDKVARGFCGERGVAVTGTLGILLAACQDGGIGFDDADATLQRTIDKGFYSPVSRISDLW